MAGAPVADPIRMLAVAYMPAGNTIIHSSRRNPAGGQAAPPPRDAERGKRGDEPGGHRPEGEPDVGQRGPQAGP
ncbi:MAG TPA: hypothetical protein VKU77_37410 [Streptosporangiaceae bacterium]|nr:hypothetical protein [Streptosporangiaceae bacterium]